MTPRTSPVRIWSSTAASSDRCRRYEHGTGHTAPADRRATGSGGRTGRGPPGPAGTADVGDRLGGGATIGRESGASLAALQWVVHGYNLTFASFLLACGSLADRWGRRRVFGGGAALFTVASAVSAVAHGILVLDLARALAGVGAAALLTSGSS
ncbi:MFS transporter [Streptomyces nogalater]